MALPFQPSTEEMRTAIIRSELQALTKEAVKMDKHRQYFDGDQPLVYSTELFNDVFGDAFEGFSDNWCKVVVNAAADRIRIPGLNFAQYG